MRLACSSPPAHTELSEFICLREMSRGGRVLVVWAQLGGNGMAQEWGSEEKLGTPLPRALANA